MRGRAPLLLWYDVVLEFVALWYAGLEFVGDARGRAVQRLQLVASRELIVCSRAEVMVVVTWFSMNLCDDVTYVCDDVTYVCDDVTYGLR